MDMRRRVRGMVGLAVTSGLALAALGTSTMGLGLATGLVPSAIFGPRALLEVALRGLVLGGVAGALFGWLLASRERGRLLSTLSRRRVAVWGFASTAALTLLAGLAVPALSGLTLPLAVVAAATVLMGVGGSLFGVGLLTVARLAPERALERVVDRVDEATRLPERRPVVGSGEPR